MRGEVDDGNRVAIVDLADELQVRKQRLFKVMARLGIGSVLRRESARKGQMVATVTCSEADALRAALALASGGATAETREPVPSGEDVGVFYLLQLEPRHDPGRFKVGFTVEVEGRVRKHRTSAPFAAVVKTWPCRRAWERTAIDSVTAGCEQLHTEVFRAAVVEEVVGRADRFFAVMPAPGSVVVHGEGSECETAG